MNKQLLFTETESDFYHFLTTQGGVNNHSRTNYMSWLKFLSQFYVIDRNITEERINNIIDNEKNIFSTRKIYSSEKDLVNFRSALRKYNSFVNSNYLQERDESVRLEIKKVQTNNTISQTERTAIVQSRIGQGDFRDNLIVYWGGCAISGCKKADILVASHIKPWRDSDNKERLDLYNGLLLLPNYDKLFDKGYISFDTNGRILMSKYLNVTDRKILGLNEQTNLLHLEDSHRQYLNYHNEHCFMR